MSTREASSSALAVVCSGNNNLHASSHLAQQQSLLPPPPPGTGPSLMDNGLTLLPNPASDPASAAAAATAAVNYYLNASARTEFSSVGKLHQTEQEHEECTKLDKSSGFLSNLPGSLYPRMPVPSSSVVGPMIEVSTLRIIQSFLVFSSLIFHFLLAEQTIPTPNQIITFQCVPIGTLPPPSFLA